MTVAASQPAPKYRKKFTWEAVDAVLIRELLVGVYDSNDREEEAHRVKHMPLESLRLQVRKSLGSPLSTAAMKSNAVVDSLREYWLPKARREDLDRLVGLVQLGLAGEDRYVEFANKGEIVTFLQARNRTDTFRKNLRTAFVAAHKRPMPVAQSNGSGGQTPSAGPVTLVGAGAIDPRPAYQHQVESWDRLDEMFDQTDTSKRAGLLVLPTGAGKTHTMVSWLTARVNENPDLRVLWIADQRELIAQAHRAFVHLAPTMDVDVTRKLRSVHGGASPSTSLADPDLSVACVTRQSLIGRRLDAPAKKRLREFLTRPVVVVIDEAHHAVSPTYQELLQSIRDKRDDAMIVGLTATPWPMGFGMTARLWQTLPTTVHTVEAAELVRTGILARPQNHELLTHEYVETTKTEASQIAGRDVPPSVLRRLDRDRRNSLIVDTWAKYRSQWGKTLVFVGDIAHADHLGKAFNGKGEPALVMHSALGEDALTVLEEFREIQHPIVLISVGMLLEGVDVPDARTAFLARPTSSRVVMRQMIGRVLRGPQAGGDAIAHVVDVRDRWDADIDVLQPVEIPGVEWDPPDPEHAGPEALTLPRVRDEESGAPLGEDVVRRIEKAFSISSRSLPEPRAFDAINLLGYYQLGHLNVPVFDHTREEWEELVRRILKGQRLGRGSFLDVFDHVACPQPTREDVASVVDFCRSNMVEPPFVPARATVSARKVAEALHGGEPLSDDAKVSYLSEVYRSTLCRGAYDSFQAFYEAVHQELLDFTVRSGAGKDPDGRSPTDSATSERGPRAKPQFAKNRAIEPIFKNVVSRARELVRGDEKYDYEGLLASEYLPQIRWTPRKVKSAYAYWSPRISGGRKGDPIIRVNSALRVSKFAVPDDVLEFLIWHELCHHLLPGRGHDSEFRRLEAMWDDSARLDHELDSLSEQFELF